MRDCLRRLRPVSEVRALLLPNTIGGGVGGVGGVGGAGGAGGAGRVGVHIRMLVDQMRDVPGIEADGRSDSNLELMNEARPYRAACHYREFLPHMHAMRAAQPSTQFYVASDSAEAYAAVSAAFEPGVVASLHGEARGFNCTGAERRRLPCQRIALADMLNLAASRS